MHQHARFQGLCNNVGIARNLQLVRERIVDAWLCGLPDLPDPLDLEALANFPSLALSEGAYPKVEEGLTESAATISYATALSLEPYSARYPKIRLVG